jgi:hypothetical protein
MKAQGLKFTAVAAVLKIQPQEAEALLRKMLDPSQ